MSTVLHAKAGRVMATDEFSLAGREYFVTDVSHTTLGDIMIQFVPSGNHTAQKHILVLNPETDFDILT